MVRFMNGNDLLHKMSDVDGKLIIDAEKKPRRKKVLIGLGAAAAACLAVVTGINILPSAPDYSKYNDLPKLSLSDYSVSGSGSRERYLSEEDLKIRSPWDKGMKLETLPVYLSSSTDPDVGKMRERVIEAAAALGFSEDELEITDTYLPGDEGAAYHRRLMEKAGASEEEIMETLDRIYRTTRSFTTVTAKAKGVTIDLDSAFTLNVRFDPFLELPDGYLLNTYNASLSESESAKVSNYLAEKYQALLHYEKPLIQVNQHCAHSYRKVDIVYEGAEDPGCRIANYWLNYTEFIAHEAEPGTLYIIRIKSNDGCEKLGDYPIISAKEAEALLKSDKYPEKERMPRDAKIVKTDIYYSNHCGSTAVIPYYWFYVETDRESYVAGYDIVYDVYEIPAIPEEFLEGVETGDYGVYA